MPRGLPKSYIKKWGVSKRAWREYRKKHPKRKSKSRASKPKTKKRKTRRSGGSKRMGKGGKSLQRTVFKWLRIAALVGPGAVAFTKGGTTEEKLSYVLAKYTGYQAWDERFNFSQLVEGYGPFLVTTLVTYGIPKIAGIIRRL